MAYDAAPVSDAVIAHKKPGTVQMLRQLRDNALAMILGLTGAPRIYGKACTPPSQLSEAVQLTVTAADTYTLQEGAGVGITIGDQATTSATYVAARTILIQACITGTVRFKASHSATAGLSEMRITKNGSVVNSWSTSSTSAVARVEDIAVVPTDTVVWEHRNAAGSNFSAASETASDGYTRIAPLIRFADL